MTSANDPELVPSHYASGYLHWDFVVAVGMGYFEAAASKYIARWRKKDGLKDLRKALHYIDKLIEVYLVYHPKRYAEFSNQRCDRAQEVRTEVFKFGQANALSKQEYFAIWELAQWHNATHLCAAREAVLDLIKEAEAKPVPVEDSNKHADRMGW